MNKMFFTLLVVVISVFASKANASIETQVNCLANNIYHEARGEKSEGRYAVAWVTMNRVKSKKFPNTICGVVHQAVRHNGKLVKHRCQFSWYCDGKSDRINTHNIIERRAWQNAKDIAVDVMTMQMKDFDPTKGAVMYHNTHVKPKWRKSFKKTVKIGRHIFYK